MNDNIYCPHCGHPLLKQHLKIVAQYNIATGEPEETIEYMWECTNPKRIWWIFKVCGSIFYENDFYMASQLHLRFGSQKH